MHFKQLEQLIKDSFNLSTIVYAEETEQSVLDNLMHPGVHAGNSIKVAHYSQKRTPHKGCPFLVSKVDGIEQIKCGAEHHPPLQQLHR